MKFLVLSLVFLCLASAQISLPLRQSTARTPRLRAYASAPIANEENVFYTVDIGIGNPAQNFTVWPVFYHSWTWVYSSSSIGAPRDAKEFNTTVSSTYNSGNNSYELELIDGSLTGTASQDDIRIGNVTAKQASFLLVTSIEVEEEIDVDGSLGLGFSPLPNGNLTLIEQLNATGLIPKALFSLYLSSNNESQSTLLLGAIDLGKYAVAGGNLSYVNLHNEDGLWLSRLDSVSVEGVKVHHGAAPVLFEFGIPGIFGPAEVVSKALEKINFHKKCHLEYEEVLVCPFNASHPIESYPTLAFTFHEQAQNFTVRPQTYFFQEGDKLIALLFGIPDDVWILGNTFLREYYSVYDVEKKRIGLVRSVDVVVTASGFGYMPLFWVGLVGVALGTLYYKQNRKGKKEGNYYLLVDLKEGLIR